ncbi:glutamate racemase [Cohnella yongneupensis]|uniref:Glutamate racemase n=1 Tax=Cohnella yongneupensis TaxID=425006 RepID=A0ABW0QYP5_9BACL
MQRAIAVLDSGVGGLTVVKELMRQLPREKICYFGDTARTPYGPRLAEEVIAFTREIVDYLVQFDPKMIVIACNTATAVALEDIRCRVSLPVVGVIEPGARAAINLTNVDRIGVIGTEGTIKSGAYELALKQLSPRAQVVSLACPSFVPLVENGIFRSREAYRAVAEALQPMRSSDIDCLILGCTHYPFLAAPISEAMGNEVALVHSAEETAREIVSILRARNELADACATPVHHFFCSGDPEKFQYIARDWLGDSIRLTPVVWQVPHIQI